MQMKLYYASIRYKKVLETLTLFLTVFYPALLYTWKTRKARGNFKGQNEMLLKVGKEEVINTYL